MRWRTCAEDAQPSAYLALMNMVESRALEIDRVKLRRQSTRVDTRTAR